MVSTQLGCRERRAATGVENQVRLELGDARDYPVADIGNPAFDLGAAYRQPLQARLVDPAVLARHGIDIHANRPEDITAAVRYGLNCLDETEQPLRAGDGLLERYRATFRENPYNLGAAAPAPSFFESFPELLGGKGAWVAVSDICWTLRCMTVVTGPSRLMTARQALELQHTRRNHCGGIQV
jgi:hypothetical protein